MVDSSEEQKHWLASEGPDRVCELLKSVVIKPSCHIANLPGLNCFTSIKACLVVLNSSAHTL